MRMIFTAVSLIVMLHVLAAAGFVAWLEYSGRLNRERIDAAVELFEPTIAEAEKQKQQAEEAGGRRGRRGGDADGVGRRRPRTLQQRLAEQREADELAEQRYQRLLQEKQVLKDQLARMRRRITEMRESLAEEREAFEQMVERQKELREDEDFQQAVELLERSSPSRPSR